MKKFNDYTSQLVGESVETMLSDKAKLSLYKKSSNSDIPVSILEEVYRRGYTIWNDKFGGTPEQFAFDRVNSFIAGGFAAQLDEDLRQWFDPNHPKGGWKRINSKGEAIGPCAREPGEPKPKCMSNEKRAQLSKKERAAAVAAKRRHDPVADRSGKGGKPVNVSNFGKGKISEEYLEEKNAPTNPSLWSKAKSLARAKFDVYPSAYANGWAAKWYKARGGGWKSVSEDYIGEQTAIIAAGTNDWGDSNKAYSGVSQMIKNSIARGEKPVLVLPNKNVRGTSNAYDGAYKAAKEAGVPTEYPSSFDKDGIHLSSSAASQIKQKYGNIPAYGDSNSVRLGAKEGITGFTGKSSGYIASRLSQPQNNVDTKPQPSTSVSPAPVKAPEVARPNPPTNTTSAKPPEARPSTPEVKSNVEPVNTVKTSVGDYPVYSKGSEPATSFKAAFDKAYAEKPGENFKWAGADKVERVYKAVKENRELKEKCWTGYKQVGMKKKGERMVPNCVPVKEEELNKKVMTPEQIADKHGVSVESINTALKRGIQVEKEHTTHAEEARRIALAHLGEDPNYYKKLDKAGLEEGKVQDAAKIAAILGSLGGHAYNVSNVASHSDDPALAAATVASYLHPASRLLQAAPSVFKVNKAGKGENEFLRQKRYNKSVKEDAEAHSKDFKKPSSRFIGSNELVDIYKSQTPGQIIKKVIREHLQEVAMAMPPQVTPPAIVGQVRPGVRVAPKPTEVSGRASGRIASQSSSMTARPNVKVTSGVQPSIERSWKTSGRASVGTGGGSMSATPKVSTSYSQGGVNVGKTMSTAKQTSPVVKGMTDAGRSAMVGAEKAAPTLAKGLGTAARIATGPAATAAMAVMSPTPAGAGEDEKKRQETLKSYNPYKPQGDSVSDYERKYLTPQKYEAPKAAPTTKVDAPTPPTRPKYMEDPVKTIHTKGGDYPVFRKSGEAAQSFQSAIKAGSETWKSPGETGPERKYKPETESGGKTLKKIKEAISEATYKGKTVPLNKPMKGDVKKSKVFVDPDGDGKAQKVNFGDKNMSIKKDQPARKRSYCARSGGISGTNDKTSANYWSRRAWNCEETE